MAVGRISGPLLKANLERNGIDLAVETNLLYIDVNNNRIGVKKSNPQYDLDVNGIIRSDRINTNFLTVADNYNIGNVNITSTVSNLELQPATEFDRTVVIGDLEVTGEILNYTSGFNIVNDASSSIFVDPGSAIRFSDGVDTVISLSSDATHEIIEVNSTSTLDSVTGRGNTTTNTISVGSITTPLVVGDVKGSVFADDSSVMVDAVGNVVYTNELVTPQIVAATTLNISTGGDYTVSSPGNIQMNATGGAVYVVSPITDLSGTLQVGTIDTSDSSAITVIPPVNFNADVIAENDLQVNNHATVTQDLTVNGDIAIPDNSRIKFGDGADLVILHNGTNSIVNNNTGTLTFNNFQDDGAIVFNTDDGAGGTTNYIRMTGSTGEVQLYHYGSEKLATKSTGVDVTGNLVVSGQLETSTIDTSDSSSITVTPAAVFLSDVTIENDLVVTNKVTAAEFIGDGSQLTGLVATYADLTDTDITGRTANSLTRFNGANYVPTALSEDGSGNVTVAGQLNVSIIDTADSSAITITPAAIFSSDVTVENDLVVTNKVTAAEFIGDGSQLTNLTAANLTGAVPNNFITLGQDTTGNYVQTATGTLNEIQVQFSGVESADIQIGLPDDVTIGGELTVTTGLFTPLIDTTDSSPLTITPAVVMNSDLTVENGLKVNSIETTDSSSLDILNAVIMRSDLNVENDVDVRNVVRATYFEGDGSRLTGVALEGGGGAIRAEEFPTVTGGLATVTMSQAYDIDTIDVYLNGVRLKKVVDYTVSSTTLTFNETLDVNDSVALYAYDTAELLLPSVRLEEFPVVSGGSPNVTMSGVYALDQIDVYLNGARLQPTVDYSVSGTTLTFTSNLDAADVVALYVYDTASALAFEYVKVEEFPTVTNGSPDVTMSGEYSLSQIDVYLNGARLKPAVDFTVSGTTLTIGTNLATNDVVAVLVNDFAYKLTGASSLNDIQDVNVTGQATDTLIRYDGANYVPTQASEDASGNLTVAGQLNVSIIDTADSSALTVTPAVTFSSDITVENNLVSNNFVEAADGYTMGGLNSFRYLTGDDSSFAIGSGALQNWQQTSSGWNNIAIGKNVLAFQVGNGSNIGIGTSSQRESNGFFNVGIGRSTLVYNSSEGNVALGDFTLTNLFTGQRNTAVGYVAGNDVVTGTDNTMIGAFSQGQATGSYNTSVGYAALENASSNNNTAIGWFAGNDITSGTRNVAMGAFTLDGLQTGNDNTALGNSALGSVISGSFNVGLGRSAGFSATGSNNTFLGARSALTVTSGSNLTVIGYEAEPSSGSATNEITLGDNNVTKLRVPGAGFELTSGTAVFDTKIEVPVIDTADSSAITITPDVVMSAGLTVGNHIVPSSNENIDLGSASFRFRDLYLSGQSIDLGGVQITKSGSAIELPAGSTIQGVQIGTVESGGDADTLNLQAGSYYLDGANFTGTLPNDYVTLGTMTTGNYVATISGTANEVEVSGSGSETAAVTIGLPNDVTIGNDLTVTNTIQDAQGNVRALEVTTDATSSVTIASGSTGKYFRLTGTTVTININAGNFAAGDIITLHNATSSDMTIDFDANFTDTVYIAGDGTNKNNSTITLAAYGLATCIAFTDNGMIVNGNVS